MTKTLTIAEKLNVEAALLYGSILQEDRAATARSAELELLIHEAEAREHRRAAFHRRDAACYRLGAALEPGDGLALDPVALTGWYNLGDTGTLLLTRLAVRQPNSSITQHLATLFRSPAGSIVRAYGTWVRWQRLRELYLEETERFLASPAGRDPEARWRRDKPTNRQTYLIAEICLDLQIEYQSFATRGDAFNWIEQKGGNPRFRHEPPVADLRELAEAFR